MPLSSYFVVIIAIFVPAAIFYAKAKREQRSIRGIEDFFPLRRSLSVREYRSTTVAAGMSLATVFIAFINLSPFLGMTLLVSALTMGLAFFLLYFFVPKIMDYNKNNDSIQSYLGKSYDSEMLRRMSIFFSLVGYISIFSMELIVGVTVIEPFLGDHVIAFSSVYFVFIIFYSLLSGYRAVVATDVLQLRFVILGVVVLVAFCVWKVADGGTVVSTDTVLGALRGHWVPAWSFVAGIAIMNLPAPISDTGTWQRLCSAENSGVARKGVLQVAGLFGVLWLVLVLASVALASIASGSGFDPTSGTLMSWLIESLGSGGVVGLALLLVLFLGLFSAMMSTADSLLIVAGQLFAVDILGLARSEGGRSEALRRVRISMAAIALLSFVLFSMFYALKFDVVQLVFSVYGAQLSMFPAVLMSLCVADRMKLRGMRCAASLSIVAGFVFCWISAFYGKFGGDSAWMYNAPAVALLSSFLVFILCVCFQKARSRIMG